MYYRLSLAALLVAMLITMPFITNLPNGEATHKRADVGTIFILDDCTRHERVINTYSLFISFYAAKWLGNATNSVACYDFTDNEHRNIWLNFFEIEQRDITLFVVDNRVPHAAKWLGVANLTSGVTHAQISYNTIPDSKIISHELAHQLAQKKYNDPRIAISWVHCMSESGKFNNVTIGQSTQFYYLKPYDGSECKHVDTPSSIAQSALGRYLDYRLKNWKPYDITDMFILEFDAVAHCTTWQVLIPNSGDDDAWFQVAHLYGGTMNFAKILIKEDTVVQYCTPAGLEVYAASLWTQSKAE